jgi:hypothetical protein
VQAIPPDIKVTIDGGNGIDLTYPKWLKAQPEAVQREALGPGRFKLFQAGRLPISAMATPHGRPLTLTELRQRRRIVSSVTP